MCPVYGIRLTTDGSGDLQNCEMSVYIGIMCHNVHLSLTLQGGGGTRERTILLTPQPSRETLRASGIARRSPATVSAGLRTASKGSSPPEQNQTRACGASRSARASKSHQTTTDGAQ
ncbi:hypothetical protein SFRURICE_016699 [Spodoptera frugiperda]|nr:hypothetical protein SFRURICE_016699 [Spodoptera frugiperda]